LCEWKQGDAEAGDALVRLVYEHLQLLASSYLRHEPLPPSIQTTELIHETWLRLFGHEDLTFENRAHFFVIAARQMRRILIDRARGAHAHRRIPKARLLPMSDARNLAIQPDEQLLLLDEALQTLEAQMPRAGQVVELRYFAGLTEAEIARILNISVTTVKRDWKFAKLWLFDRLGQAGN
jgi:RNA polymerase sigma factor (TIGR02999 family)